MYNWILEHMLTLITFIPLMGAILVLALPSSQKYAIKVSTLVATLIPLILSVLLYQSFNITTSDMQFVEQFSWIPSFNIYYYLGIDGLSLPMVLLTCLLSTLCIVASWNIENGLKGYMSLFLLLETGMLGVFLALDFFLFFVFWEVMLLPMYFLIGIWGGPKKEYAAIKFFLYTLFGSVLMLIVMLSFYFYSEPHTFDLIELAKPGVLKIKDLNIFGIALGILDFKKVLFILLFIGFAIKVPIFPFHTW